MNYKKVLPAVALTLGVTAQLAANAEIFQMNEVPGHGALLACSDHKCAAGACGSSKTEEHKSDAKEHGKTDAKMSGEHHLGTKTEAGANASHTPEKKEAEQEVKPVNEHKTDAGSTKLIAESNGETTKMETHHHTEMTKTHSQGADAKASKTPEETSKNEVKTEAKAETKTEKTAKNVEGKTHSHKLTSKMHKHQAVKADGTKAEETKTSKAEEVKETKAEKAEASKAEPGKVPAGKAHAFAPKHSQHEADAAKH